MDKTILPVLNPARFELDTRLSAEHLQRFSPETLFAMRTALKVGRAIRGVKVSDVSQVNTKAEGTQNLFTVADSLSRRTIQDELRTHYPHDLVLTEEVEPKPADPLTAPRLWVIDELDGSFNFSRQIKYYAVAIGFLKLGKPVSGVVYFPPTDELFYGEVGVGAFLDEMALGLRRESNLTNSSVTTNASYHTTISDRHLDLLKVTGTPRITVCGSTVMSLTEVVAGRHDLAFALDTKPWDVAAPWALLTALGEEPWGVDGRKITILDSDILFGNPALKMQFVNKANPLLKEWQFMPKRYSL